MVFQEYFTIMSIFFKNVIIFNTSPLLTFFFFKKLFEMERYAESNHVTKSYTEILL